MNKADCVIAVFPDHPAAEAAVKKLSGAGVAIDQLSVVGKGYHVEEKVVGFYNIGIPKDSVVRYETEIGADGFLVSAHGTATEALRAKEILAEVKPALLDLHHGGKATATPRPEAVED